MEIGDIKTIELTFVNAFLIKVNDGFILVDTGLSMQWEKLERELIESGCLPDHLKLVLITHGDLDHTGNCLKLQEKYQSKIALHKADNDLVEFGVRTRRKVRTFSAMIFVMIRRLMRSKLMKSKLVADKFKPDLFLTDGQRLDEYGFNAKIIHIPGHTKGSIGILTDDGKLLAGDIFTNRRKPDLATYIENSKELGMSYAKLKTMNINTIYPGHGKPFEMDQIAHLL